MRVLPNNSVANERRAKPRIKATPKTNTPLQLLEIYLETNPAESEDNVEKPGRNW